MKGIVLAEISKVIVQGLEGYIVVGISSGTLVVNSPSGTVEFIDPEKAVHLTVMPF